MTYKPIGKPFEAAPGFLRALFGHRRQLLAALAILFAFLLITLMGFIGCLPDFQERVGGSYENPSLSWAKIFGTDVFGRSVLYKVLAGCRIAVTLGLAVAAIALPMGVTLGALAGYFGGKVDGLVTWLHSVVSSVPGILLIIAISYLLGKGLAAVCIAMGATYWVGLCRLVRAEAIKQRHKEYVLASRLLGASNLLIIVRHLLPNTIHLAIVTGSLIVLSAMKSEVLLTYIGVGVQDGSSWGTMIADAPGELTNGIWWPLAAVVLAMFLMIYSLNMVADAARDALDPKLGSSRIGRFAL